MLGLNISFLAPGGDVAASAVSTSYGSLPSCSACSTRLGHIWSRTHFNDVPVEKTPNAEVNMPGMT